MKRYINEWISRMVNYVLGKSSIIQGIIIAFKNQTKLIRDHQEIMSTLAKSQIDDRDAIGELYELYSDVLVSSQTKQTPSPPALPAAPVKSKLTPIEQVQFDEKKKWTVN